MQWCIGVNGWINMITAREATIKNAMETTLIDCWCDHPTPSAWNEDMFVIVDAPDTIETHMKEMFPCNTPDLDELFEGIYGLEWGYYDEYCTCDELGIVIRTEPDSYGWMADFWVHDCGITSGDFIRDEPDEYIEYLTNNYKDANTIFDDEQLESMGWINTNDSKYCQMFEHCDCPKTVLEEVQENYPNYNVIFSITSVGQFGLDYTTFVQEVIDYGEV